MEVYLRLSDIPKHLRSFFEPVPVSAVSSLLTIGLEPLRVPHDYTAKVDVSHFAAFPTELPTRCIKVSTSERGVCPSCGAPWARVIDHQNYGTAVDHKQDAEQGKMRWRNSREAGYEMPTTIAWRPTCEHGDLAPVPATVLDCFSGAGTTVLAAVRLGRDAIGIELREEYVALSQARIVEDAPMLAGAGDVSAP